MFKLLSICFLLVIASPAPVRAVAFPASVLIGIAFGSTSNQTYNGKPLFPLVSPPPKRDDSAAFEDRFIHIKFSILKRLEFQLTNKGTTPIEVNWDQAAYVDVGGQTHRVFHQGVRFMERDRQQPASVIPGGASLDDLAHPVDYVELKDGKWEMRDLINLVEMLQAESAYRTGSLKLLLPMKIGNIKKSYQFVFKLAASVPTAKK